jgi:hypothetical protein
LLRALVLVTTFVVTYMVAYNSGENFGRLAAKCELKGYGEKKQCFDEGLR